MQSVSPGEIASFQQSFFRAAIAAVVSAEIAFKEAEEEAARRLRELSQKEEDERLRLEAESRNRNLESGMQISMENVLLFGYAGGSKIDLLSGMAGRFYHPGLPKTLDTLKDVPEGSVMPGAAGLRIDFAGKPVLQTDAEGTVVVNKFIGTDFESNYFASFFKVRSNSPLSEEPRRIIEELNRGKPAVVEPVKEGFRGSDRGKQPAAKSPSRAANPARSVPSPSVAPPLKSARSSDNQQSLSSQLSQHRSLGSDSKSRHVAERLVEFSAAVGKPVEVKGTHYVWKAAPDGRCRIDAPNRGCLLADDGCGNFRSRMTDADLEHFEKALPELMKMKPVPARPYESQQPKKSQLEL
ncbi:MAG: hypothetical protein ACRC62_12855 [Microcoleus sp.]